MKRKVDKRRWYFASFNLLLVFLAVICAIAFTCISRQLDSLNTAERWQGTSEMPFTQIACFLPVDNPKSTDEIAQFRNTLDNKLVERSLESKNGNLYVDAYSAEAKLTVKGDHGSAQIRTIGVGGEFFLFHPLLLRSGNYISESDLMQDKVILDETAAWTLFGSSDVAGMSVFIDDRPYYVAGVVHREDDFATREGYGDEAGMFLSYDSFYELTGNGVTCYEVVLPNLVSGFGLDLVRENFDVGSGDLVENSLRYSLKNLVSVIGDFGVRSMRNNGVIYPYWENAVRMTEDWLALCMFLVGLLIACPVVTLIVGLIRVAVKTGKYLEFSIPDAAEKMIEKRRWKKWNARQQK